MITNVYIDIAAHKDVNSLERAICDFFGGVGVGDSYFTGRHIGGDTHITNDVYGDTHITVTT